MPDVTSSTTDSMDARASARSLFDWVGLAILLMLVVTCSASGWVPLARLLFP